MVRSAGAPRPTTGPRGAAVDAGEVVGVSTGADRRVEKSLRQKQGSQAERKLSLPFRASLPKWLSIAPRCPLSEWTS